MSESTDLPGPRPHDIGNGKRDPGAVASAYAAKGLYVIPIHGITHGKCDCRGKNCSSPGKHPMTANGLHDATRDERQILEWFAGHSRANVGIVTGEKSGVVVLDIDVANSKMGRESLADLEREHGPLPKTVTANTGSGGLHFYFKCPVGGIPSRNAVRDGVDFKGNGGYVVAPDSTHHSGGVYSWDPAVSVFADLPDWLASVITEKKHRPSPAPPAVSTGARGYGRAALDREAAAVRVSAEGTRNETLNRAAFSLGQLVGGGVLSETDVSSALMDAALAAGLGSAEVRRTIDSGLEGGKAEPRGVPAVVPPRTTPLPVAPFTLPKVRKPFPTDAFPAAVADMIIEAAQTIGCDEVSVALPMLVAFASAIGMTRIVRLKRGWEEPLVLWGVLIAESGEKKSPPLAFVLKPVYARQKLAHEAYQKSILEYEAACRVYEADLTRWRKTKEGDSPVAPTEPVYKQCVAGDTTLEALVAQLAGNPRGILRAQDELAAWIGAFDIYRGGRGADAAKWLELFRAGTVIVNRKAGDLRARALMVSRAAVWVLGTIQPETLKRALGREHFENGLASRLLLARPERVPHVWTNDEISDATESRLNDIFDRLFALTEFADGSPVVLTFNAAGAKLFREFYDAHGQQLAAVTGDLAAAYSKLEGYTARIAGVMHEVRKAVGEVPTTAISIDELSVAAAIRLVEWFRDEAERNYDELRATPAEGRIRQLIEIIRSAGGSITPRRLTRRSREFGRNAEVATASLQSLADANLGVWKVVPPGPAGGRPARTFFLIEPPAPDQEEGLREVTLGPEDVQ